MDFGNYCTVPSNGRNFGFWSNKNGQAILTGSSSGSSILSAYQAVLNGPPAYLGTADVGLVTFTSYPTFKTWLLNATATNMAYMLSAQLAALEPDVQYGFVNGSSFDICSGMTVNALIAAAKTTLIANGNTPSGNPNRLAQELLKNCIDAISNNGQVVPVAPCDYLSASVSCGQ